ncbi:MAG: ribonuclease E/G [Lachnospiraceae bacterium]|nr:ribonuclease E/G [Lachnospiraceae bacterium]
MNKLIITRWENQILTALFSEKEALELGLEEDGSILGNIYIGRISRIVKNLNAAFVDFGQGRTGYYSLADNPVSLPVRKALTKFMDSCQLKCGDEIIVQVARDAVGTKDPVLTANLNFAGKYVVLSACKKSVAFSAKIHDRTWKDEMRLKLEGFLKNKAGLIVRTNGYEMDEAILEEASVLLEDFCKILESADYRIHGSLLRQAEPEYIKSLKSCHVGTTEEIITDEKEIFDTVCRYLEQYQPDDKGKLRFYQDPLVSLAKLYSLKTVMEQACQKKVWLKSGGYLVIEATEAMVVIDVNTGKYSGKKNQEDTIRMINLEAAKEICHQLRLRNLSGIIIVDFIDMKADEDKAFLMEQLRCYAALDPVKTTVVDMTQLNLVELTRKKGKKPLREQLTGMVNKKKQ